MGSLGTCTQSNALSGSTWQKCTSRRCAKSLWDQKFLDLRNSNVCHHVKNSLPLIPDLTWTRTIQYASSCPVSLSSFWILSSPPALLILPRNISFQIFFVKTQIQCVLHINPFYTSSRDHPSDIWWGVCIQMINPFIRLRIFLHAPSGSYFYFLSK